MKRLVIIRPRGLRRALEEHERERARHRRHFEKKRAAKARAVWA